jgi:hypothetical protein
MEAPNRRSPRLLDVAALVVGYGFAALLVRAFWRTSDPMSLRYSVLLGLEYLWLGFAMGGPFIFLFDRREGSEADPKAPPGHTWAEKAWLLIGAYWICLAVLIVPRRLSDNPFLGLFPIIAALVLWRYGPRRSKPTDGGVAWTHHAAITLLLTWPLAWIVLILLSKTMS